MEKIQKQIKIKAKRLRCSCFYNVELNELETAMKLMGIKFSDVEAPDREQSLASHINDVKNKGLSVVLLFKDEIDQLNELWKNRKKL